MFSDEVYNNFVKEIQNIDINDLQVIIDFYNQNTTFSEFIKEGTIDWEDWKNYNSIDIIKSVIVEYNNRYNDLKNAKTIEEVHKVSNVLGLIIMFNVLHNFLNTYGFYKPIKIENNTLICEVYKNRADN